MTTKPTTLKEAAIHYAKGTGWRLQRVDSNDEFMEMLEDCFLAGAEFERARILEIIRDETCWFNGVTGVNGDAAKWLERTLKNGDE